MSKLSHIRNPRQAHTCGIASLSLIRSTAHHAHCQCCSMWASLPPDVWHDRPYISTPALGRSLASDIMPNGMDQPHGNVPMHLGRMHITQARAEFPEPSCCH